MNTLEGERYLSHIDEGGVKFIHKKFISFHFFIIIHSHNSLRNDYSNCAPMNLYFCGLCELVRDVKDVENRSLPPEMMKNQLLSRTRCYTFIFQLKFLELQAIFHIFLPLCCVLLQFQHIF